MRGGQDRQSICSSSEGGNLLNQSSNTPLQTLPAVQCHVADVLVRRLCGGVGDEAADQSPSEVRVAIIGNVDSGKSTFVGVLTRSMLDDGRGLARAKVGT